MDWEEPRDQRNSFLNRRNVWMKLTEQHRQLKLQHAADTKTAGHLETQQKLLRAPMCSDRLRSDCVNLLQRLTDPWDLAGRQTQTLLIHLFSPHNTYNSGSHIRADLQNKTGVLLWSNEMKQIQTKSEMWSPLVLTEIKSIKSQLEIKESKKIALKKIKLKYKLPLKNTQKKRFYYDKERFDHTLKENYNMFNNESVQTTQNNRWTMCLLNTNQTVLV